MGRDEMFQHLIARCVMRGNIALAREYALDLAAERDGRLTDAEFVASVEARLGKKMPRLECEKEPGRGIQPKGRNHG